MVESGFKVVIEDVEDMAPVRARYPVPVELQGCHTAIVDGYIIEGHVPAEDIRRLLAKRPDVVGLAVPGMPAGSPGMEIEGEPDQPYDVFAFSEDGTAEVFASYP
jgi:hypothetical protein